MILNTKVKNDKKNLLQMNNEDFILLIKKKAKQNSKNKLI